MRLNLFGSVRPGRRAGSARIRPRAESLELRTLLSADLQISESALPTTVTVNNPVQLTITASNDGTSDASDVVVVDALPENYQFVTSNPPSGQFQPTGHLVSFNLGTLKSGQSQTLMLTVVPTQVGAWSDWSSIYSNTPGGGTATASTRVTALPTMPNQADVGVKVTDYPSPQTPGSPITYNFDVSNYGPNTATGVVVTDALPPTFTYNSSTGGGTYDPATNSVIWKLGNLADMQDVPLQVMATPNDAGDYTNWINVRSDAVDPVESNNDASITTPVHTTPTTGIADLAVYQNVKNTPNNAGAGNTYNTHVQNLGPATATGVIAVDYLPAGVTYDSATVTISGTPAGVSGTYNPANHSVSFPLGTLTAGSSVDITLKVTDAATGTWDNRILVRADQQDTSPTYFEETETANDQSEGGGNADSNQSLNGPDADAVLNNLSGSPYGVLPSPLPTNTDLQVTTTVSPVGPVAEGTPVTYTFTVANNGMGDAPNVILTDQIDSSVLYQSSSPSGTLLPDLGILVFNLGNIPNMGMATVSVTVVPTVTGTIDNLAIVRPGAIDTTPGNNISTEDLDVIQAPQVQSLVWYGVRHQPSTLALTYDQPMDPSTAGDLSNYRLVELGSSGRLNARDNRTIRLSSVNYLVSQDAAILSPARHLNLHRRYALIIRGAQPGGVRNILNVPLLDNQTFQLGGQYVQGINWWYSGNFLPEIPGSPIARPRSAHRAHRRDRG